MAYSFPVYRKGIVFRTEQIVSVAEAREIAKRIKKEYRLYDRAFREAVGRNNGASAFRTNPHETIRQHVQESHILNFPSVSFKLNEFSVESRNSVTVCMHEHQSKVWTRLTCARINGKPATSLGVQDVRHFFSLAAQKADFALAALEKKYLEHVRQAGIGEPKSERYFFQLRAFNSTNPSSETLLEDLTNGFSFSRALDSDDFQPELIDYFQVVLGKNTSPTSVRKLIHSGDLDVFGYKSSEHEAIFSATITDSQTDLCGFGFDDNDELTNDVLSHVTTKDLLKEYAQAF